ncbi:nucleotidyltransferase [Pedobacter sp. KBW06]|uniref:nucleotidyltransferase family protein n=1 Tax=Pedobacter sp. KBW06 TaxID=2153359 RepID=UPI000F5AAD72|nr:nucleotidyltransferase family protein [Pedobacter sp. KBW06]RQO67579.1 nucleotidyltransferase [Pedobacter sp. KBW06]
MSDKNIGSYIISKEASAREALAYIEGLSKVDAVLFVIETDSKLVGSLTDGDIRRGLLNGLEISQPIHLFMNPNFKYLKQTKNNIEEIKAYKKAEINLIPLIDEDFRLLEILDLKHIKTVLPLAALIMAGGKGERLKPLTTNTPKPMLKVGDKPIIEHNIDRLISFGIKDIYISVKYLKDQIIDYFGDGSSKGVNIRYIEETDALGTLGALALINEIEYEDILVLNSDILTNIDYEDFYNYYKQHEATMALASIPYHVNIPYAVLETNEHKVSAFTEKPSYIYYSNGGIYILKFSLKTWFEKGTFFNATDLMDKIISDKTYCLAHYPLLSYWLDIGKHQDYTKAQEDIKHINF